MFDPDKPFNNQVQLSMLLSTVLTYMVSPDDYAEGEDTFRGGLQETAERWAAALLQATSGNQEDPAKLLKCFEDGAERYDEIVVVRNIPYYSLCEHHVAPFFGTADVGYLPDKRIVGLSKIPRLVKAFSRRLQVQERLTQQIAGTLEKCLGARGVAVVLRGRHMCMESRGVETHAAETVTSAMLGVFKTNPSARAEFLSLTTK